MGRDYNFYEGQATTNHWKANFESIVVPNSKDIVSLTENGEEEEEEEEED